MIYRVAVIFLVLYFVRPQDWVPGLAGFNVIRPLMLIGLLSLLARKPSLNRKELLATPIDWLMVIFCGFLAYNSPEPVGAVMAAIPYLAFYYLTTLALTDSGLLIRYLQWWLACLGLIAVVGLATQFGMDITGAQEIIDQMIDRLVLNTWLLDNPNALGHTVVIAMPLAYLLLWWNRPVPAKMLAIGLAVTAYYCAFYTESKGAFLVAAAGLVASLTFGRPIFVQILVMVIALSIGTGGLMYLPRMSGMNNLRADEGVQGRLMAWELAQTTYQSSLTGQGWKQFNAVIEWQGALYDKATHSSYVKIGADLGAVGMFLYLALLCAAARALIQYPGLDDQSERCRRAIFLLLAMYMVSGWMIDRAYHTEFFLILALASAYLRQAIAARNDQAVAVTAIDPAPALTAVQWKWPRAYPEPAPASAGASTSMLDSFPMSRALPGIGAVSAATSTTSSAKSTPQTKPKKLWRRYGVIDFLIGIAALRSIIWLWDYILRTI